MKKSLDTGRDPTEAQVRESRRVRGLSPDQQKNHPSAVKADHTKLTHINTYGALPEFYMDQAFTCRKCGKVESGKPQTRSGTMKRPKVTSMRGP